MFKKFRRTFAVLLFVLVSVLLVTSCNDDEADPGFSSNNLTKNRWRIENLTYSISGATFNVMQILRDQGAEPVIYITFDKDSTYEIDDPLELFSTSGISTVGKWEMSGNKNEILSLQSSDTLDPIDLTITTLSVSDFQCYTVMNTEGIDLSELIDPQMAAMFEDEDITINFDFRVEN